MSGPANGTTASAVPIRVLTARVLTYRGRSETYASLAALFQGLCGVLRDAGTLPGVYPVLAAVKQRILSQGAPLDMDDVVSVARAHQDAQGAGDPLVLGEPRVVFSVPATAERLAYHRELVQNLRIPHRPQLTLNAEALTEVLAVLLHPRPYGKEDCRGLLDTDFSPPDALGILRILDTLYKVTFSRTLKKELCEPTIHFPLVEGGFHLLVDQRKTAHLTLPVPDLLRPLLLRLWRTPDLAALLDQDERMKARVQEGLRLFSGTLHDLASLPQRRQEVAAILRERKAAEGEDLEEL